MENHAHLQGNQGDQCIYVIHCIINTLRSFQVYQMLKTNESATLIKIHVR